MPNLWVTTDELGVDYSASPYAYEAVKVASQLLWAFSGRKYNGSITVTERYLCGEDLYNIPLSKLNPFEGIANISSELAMHHTTDNRLRLHGKPVTNVRAVRDRFGNIIDPSTYYLTDHSVLQPRLGVPWSPCDVEVTYTYGSPPPASGHAAARILAIELVKLFQGDTTNLPTRVTSIARQGVTYTILDDQDFLDNMRTGIYIVDLFLKTANPSKALARAKVFSPDVPRGHRITPKPLPLPASALDMIIPGKAGGSLSVKLSYVNAAFLVDGSGWTPDLRINNYTNTSTADIGSDAVTFDAYVTDRVATSTSIAVVSNVVTATSTAAHHFAIGDAVAITGSTGGTLDGIHYITSVPTITTFTFAFMHANVTDGAAATMTVTAASHDIATLAIGYTPAYAVLSFADPGTWDLFATRPSNSTPGTIDTVYIASGNLSIKLG